MNKDLIELYRLLDTMKQSDEVKQTKKFIEEALHRNMKLILLEPYNMGSVIGYDKVQDQFIRMVSLLEHEIE